jgi:hypothetical protein
MYLYGGGCEIERTMITKEMKEFLDRFKHPDG